MNLIHVGGNVQTFNIQDAKTEQRAKIPGIATIKVALFVSHRQTKEQPNTSRAGWQCENYRPQDKLPTAVLPPRLAR